MFEYIQDFHNSSSAEESEKRSTDLIVIHAPSSLIDLRKADDYSSFKPLSSNPKYGLKESKEIQKDTLLNVVNNEISKKKEKSYKAIITFLIENRKNQLFGDYQPNSMNVEYVDGESVDPALFLAGYLLEQSNSNENKKKELVFHPDILFFLTQGDRSKEDNVLESINSLCEALDLKIFFENIYFNREIFKQLLPWMSDPIELKNLIKNKSRLGLTVDIDHLVKENWSKDKIINTVSSLIIELKSRVIIHSRESYDNDYRELHDKSVAKGIPWINEPHSQEQ